MRRAETVDRRTTIRFAVRLLATMALTAALVGAAQYALAERQLSQRVVEQSEASNRQDARVLVGLYDATAADPWMPVQELLNHIASRPGVAGVQVLDGDGAVVLSGTPASHGSGSAGHPAAMDAVHGDDMPAMDAAHGDDMPAMGAAADMPAPVTADLIHGAPFAVDGAEFSLQVAKGNETLDAQLDDLRWVLALTLLLGVGLSVPIFYVLGGRALSARHRRAVRGASRDPLTGLANHRAFQEELRRSLATAARGGTPLSLAIVDVDRFKEVNDVGGHRRGDTVLAQVAAVLETGRADDRAFRIGGDEFAVLLPQTGEAAAAEALDRLRERVSLEPTSVTLSVGVGTIEPGDGADDLFERADAACYAAKRTGRDRVVRASQRPIEPASEDTGRADRRSGRSLFDTSMVPRLAHE